MDGKRLDYLDTAKGIGIILVCIGHACTNRSVVAECQNAWLIRFITLFHMALFFFVNGMLYNEKYAIHPVKGVIRKIKAYYIPFLIYNLIFWGLHNLFARLHLISGSLDAKDYPYLSLREFAVSFVKSVIGYRQRFAGAMWFLESLVVVAFIFIFADYIALKCFPKKRFTVLTLCVTAVALVNHLGNVYDIPGLPGSVTRMIYYGLNGLVFFYLGYLYRVYQWNRKLEAYRKQWILLFFLIVAVTTYLMSPRIASAAATESIPVYLAGRYAVFGMPASGGLTLVQFILYGAVAVAGIIMVLLLSQEKMILRRTWLQTAGKYSLHIMCLHFLAFKLVSWIIILVYRLPVERLAEYPVVKEVDGIWWIAYAVVGCTLPIAVVKGIKSLTNVLKRKRRE